MQCRHLLEHMTMKEVRRWGSQLSTRNSDLTSALVTGKPPVWGRPIFALAWLTLICHRCQTSLEWNRDLVHRRESSGCVVVSYESWYYLVPRGEMAKGNLHVTVSSHKLLTQQRKLSPRGCGQVQRKPQGRDWYGSITQPQLNLTADYYKLPVQFNSLFCSESHWAL